MKKKIILAAMTTSMLIYLLSSCYQNKEDILALPRVSFRSEVVPIITSGACGCHNNGKATNAVQFSHLDTIFYDAILSRVNTFATWVHGGTHPGGGVIDFAANEKALIKKWVEQGDPYDDGSGCTVSGAITWTTTIQPIYKTTCEGGTCHGRTAVTLTQPILITNKDKLVTMMNSGGATGHPGGPLSLSICTVNKFKEWIKQGQP
jgi:hypothetical protein